MTFLYLRALGGGVGGCVVYKKRAVPQSVRRAVALAAGAVPGETTAATCHYCGAPGSVYWPRLYSTGQPGKWVTFTDLELEHVLPESQGGPSTADNIVLACRSCNRRKGARLPEAAA